jgi:hypothetical protein
MIADQDIQPQHRERRALGKRRLGAPGERHAGDAQADRIIRSIAKKVERIGLQRLRSAGDTGNDLNGEHDRVDGKRDP